MLHLFDGTDGSYPNAGLAQSTDGMLNGTAFNGGAHGYGAVYAISPSGAFTLLHSFDKTDGSWPNGAVVQGADGNFYGTTSGGGTNGDGTVFQITSASTLTTLYSFAGTDGRGPFGTLVKVTDGNFYGTTERGGQGVGTIFQITPTGTLITLHSFDKADGSLPYGGLLQSTDGNFYGTTYAGGSSRDGTIFSLSTGLGPFVKTLPAFGKVGNTITILGADLTGATSVSFNGMPTAFTILSPTAVTATVPPGATTGVVSVTTPSGALASNLPFQIL
jgi:uncharacterized repeat protein (TIGR03803 family)